MWDITFCGQLKVNQRFGGKCRRDLQDSRINQARNEGEAGSKNIKPRRTIWVGNVQICEIPTKYDWKH